MSRESLVMVLGICVLFVPSFGIPAEWKGYVLFGAGIVLIVIGYSLRRSMYLRTIDKGNGERGTDSFVEYDGSAQGDSRNQATE